MEKRGLRDEELIARFQLGFANRTLGYRLPNKKRQQGEVLRGRLEQLGIYRASGHEHLNGSIVFPILDASGCVVEMYGRKIGESLRKGTPLHLYLPGPHRGVWNLDGIAGQREVILCESLIDAATFWVAGFRNVTTSYGVGGFTDDHWRAFEERGIRRVLIAYDRDAAGDQAATALTAKLGERGIESARVEFPKGMDANELALKLRPAERSLRVVLAKAGASFDVIASAETIGDADQVDEPCIGEPCIDEEEPSVHAADHPTEPEPAEAALGPSLSDEVAGAIPEVAKESGFLLLAAEGDASSEAPSDVTEPAGKPDSLSTEQARTTSGRVSREQTEKAESASSAGLQQSGEDWLLRRGDRRYRLRHLGKAQVGQLKLNLLVSRGEAFHVDTLELYSARQRGAFVEQAASELGVAPDVIKSDLGVVLLQLEERLEKEAAAAEAKQSSRVELSETEEAEALALLRSPRLLDRLLEDFERCGVVGEETNKLVGYLAATSRLLDEPLAVVVQSSSAAGKSSLMEAVLRMIPEEERVQYSAMTGQSLYYMSGQQLCHKVLAISEEEGAERASYALKLLQSEGHLTIASTGKDPHTGRLVTEEYRVQGPVMIFLTTTAIDIEEELLNRCLVLSVDEGREQTRAIHELQRQSRTLEGVVAKRERQALLRLHQNAQRLLRPLAVVNPHAAGLRFPDHQTRTRRDHKKYLGVIESVALLHQHQREVKRVKCAGADGRADGSADSEEWLEYIEVQPGDIEVANRLCREVLGKTLDELPPGTRRLLSLIEQMVETESRERGIDRRSYRFTRRDVRAQTGLGDTQLKVHLGRLVELEFVWVHRGRHTQRHEYELVFEGREQPWQEGLGDVLCRYDEEADSKEGPNRSGPSANRSGSKAAVVGVRSEGGRGEGRPEKQKTSVSLPRVNGHHVPSASRGTSQVVSYAAVSYGAAEG